MTELYKKYRPKTLQAVVGQEKAVKTLQGLLKKGLPHAIMFVGPPGVGKTTVARILSASVGCTPHNLEEVNCATLKDASDKVRDVERAARTRPMGGKARVWILDEVQSLSRAQFAQQGLLPVLERDGQAAYFFLCTTDPSKILPAVRSRCTQVPLGPIPRADLEALVQEVASAEKKVLLPKAAVGKIVELAQGSARQALVLLEQVLSAPGDSGVELLQDAAEAEEAFDLVRALLPWKGRPDWSKVAAALKKVEEMDVEPLRRMVLNSARAQLLKTGNRLAAEAVRQFRDNFFEGGHAALAGACYAVCDS